MGKRLKSQEFLNAASVNDVKALENKIARRVKILQELDSKNEPEASQVIEPSQVSRADDSETEDEDQAIANVRSKKRKISKSSYDNEDENENEEVIKKEQKSKKHKKRKVDTSSQNSSQPLNSIPAFEQLGREHGANNDNSNINSKKTISHASNNGEEVPQNGSSHPSPEKTRKAALLDTIIRSRPLSDSPGDGIYEALVAGMLAQPSPPSPMSSIADYSKSLIDIGRSAIAAPILPNTQKPIRDRAFKAQVLIPAAAQKPHASSGHKESPILPPVRNFSSSRILPASKEIRNEKSKSKKKDTHGKEASHAKSNGNGNQEPAVESSQEINTFSQAVTSLKEAASATVIEGIFSQADPFTSAKKILPPARSHVPTAASFPNSINSSTPDGTPTKSKSKSKSKSRRGKSGESEDEDWESTSGRVRARIDKDGATDDGEVEESK
ncbi:MAG: hypothetical protein CL912_16715 [Deltaproteobacteria bacterium]|nr:hypothetical protein [Deltaproteobacteria bacterium]